MPLPHADRIVLGHGSGGRMTHSLISRVFLHYLGNPVLNLGNDGASIKDNFNHAVPNNRLVFSTDSHVVSPLFFPGGDIGTLSVCGTTNDVCMMGAKPLYLTAGFILEEGLEISVLEQVLDSMRLSAEEANVEIIAGDTKVVQKGKADGLYITTSGFGIATSPGDISGANAQPGDIVIVSGSLGDHGIAVLAARGELGFTAEIKSDVAPLNDLVSEILSTSNQIHVLRDPTRGGLATTLNEIANQSGVSVLLDEASIPVKPSVAGACEMLGFDPLYVANEGKLVAIVAARDAQDILKVMHRNKYGKDAAIIGEIQASAAPRVLLKTPYGSTRILDTLSGELLPRIC
jgi:hydrogenase expression/formation protein HypE